MKTAVIVALALTQTPSMQVARAAVPGAALRVCSDPDNLPFSNDQGAGFENRIAEIIGQDMGARLEYVWWPQRRGFLRNTLNARKCDLVIGLPSAVDLALTTKPYYRSVYVFVSRADKNLKVSSFDDERLRTLRIGVQLIGDDGANSPPAHALTRRGIIANVIGFPVYDDPGRIVRAVGRGEIDLAVVWGPLAGFVSANEPVDLEITPVAQHPDTPWLPMAFDMSLAVRRGDDALRARLEEIVERHRGEIADILEEYRVPLVDRERF